jgi:outer membrane biogenesis lipoprotein LolB
MRSLRFALPLILLLLAACTTEPNQPPAPTVDLVATQVSVQLTALPHLAPADPNPAPD